MAAVSLLGFRAVWLLACCDPVAGGGGRGRLLHTSRSDCGFVLLTK